MPPVRDSNHVRKPHRWLSSSSSKTGRYRYFVFPSHARENKMQANPLQRAFRRSRDRGPDTRMDFDTSSVIRLVGDRRMPPSPQGEGFSNPNQRASRRRRDKGLDTRMDFDTSSVIRLAGDRWMPPSPQGEGFDQPACVPRSAAPASPSGGSGRRPIGVPSPRRGKGDRLR